MVRTCVFAAFLFLLALIAIPPVTAMAQPVVPGVGIIIDEVGDDFEQERWEYYPRHPKSSRNIDEKERGPLGTSLNKRWLEGPHRGTPDVMHRVPTPAGGLFGSQYSLMMRTRNPGIPDKKPKKLKAQQDDVMVKVRRILGHSISPAAKPSCVVRVYVPPFEEWENRTGASFGLDRKAHV